MFRWIRERRQRRESEARERREQLRRKAGISSNEPPLVSLLPGEPYRDGGAHDFALRLIAQASQVNELMVTSPTDLGNVSRTFKAGPDYTPSPLEHELPVRIEIMSGGGSGGTGHGASIHSVGGHSGHDSHSHHDSHTSYDSSSYDSSSGSSDAGGGW